MTRPIMPTERFAERKRSERRKSDRTRSNLLPLRFRAESVQGQGHVLDLSEEGLFVRTKSIPDQGRDVQISFSTPDGRRVALNGMIWRTEQKGRRPGFAVHLLGACPEYLQFVKKIQAHRR